MHKHPPPDHAVTGAIAFMREAWRGNDGAEGESVKLICDELERLRPIATELDAWEELVSNSAPLAWVAAGDSAAAHEWEKRAADMLARRARLLSLKDPTPLPGVPDAGADSAAAKQREAAPGLAVAPDNPGGGAGTDRCPNPVCSLPAGHEKVDDEPCNDLLATDRCPQCDCGVRQHRNNLLFGHGLLLCVHPWHEQEATPSAASSEAELLRQEGKRVVAEFTEERKEQLSRARDSLLTQAASGYAPPPPTVDGPRKLGGPVEALKRELVKALLELGEQLFSVPDARVLARQLADRLQRGVR